MTKTCPACGQEASGRFCSHCGTSLEGPNQCRECGNELPPDGLYCNLCGAPRVNPSAPAAPPLPPASALNQPAAAPRSSSNLPWAIAAGALVALLAVILVPRFRDEPAAPAPVSGPPITGAPAGAPGGAAGVDLASMTPREAADRLFNRVMQNVSSGDSAQARQFLPMALMAYDRVPDLDLDGYYHVAVLQLVNADPQSARAAAETILSAEPDHLFGLFTAAQAEQAMGNQETARELYQRFLDRFDAQVDSDRPEYRDHAQVLPAMREEAESAVAGG